VTSVENFIACSTSPHQPAYLSMCGVYTAGFATERTWFDSRWTKRLFFSELFTPTQGANPAFTGWGGLGEGKARWEREDKYSPPSRVKDRIAWSLPKLRLIGAVLSTPKYLHGGHRNNFYFSKTHCFNPLTPELKSSSQPCLTKYFIEDFASWTVHFVNICVKTNKCKNYSFSLLIIYGSSTYHVTRHNTPIHNILSTAFQLSISQEALGTLPGDGNVMSKHVGATVHDQ
jgi:hypothetical protein